MSAKKSSRTPQFRAAEAFAAERVIAIDRDDGRPRIWRPDARQWLTGTEHLRAEAAGWIRDTLESDERGEHYSRGYADDVATLAAREALRVSAPLGGTEFDHRADLLGLPAGRVADLRNGEIRDAALGDRVTMSTAVVPDADCPTPRWSRFLDEVTMHRGDLRAWLVRAAGYTLTGTAREEVAFLLRGTGANGKGVLIGAMVGCLGDYAATLPPDFFRPSAERRHTTELADVHKRRLIAQPEAADGPWVTQRLKILTGGDGTLRARRMREDPRDVALHGVVWSAVNNTPMLGGGDAVARRLRVAPFDFRPADPDPGLKAALAGEAPGILAALIDAAADYHRDGLAPQPECVTAESAVFATESARPLDAWLAERTEAATAETEFRLLFEDAQEWFELGGHARTPSSTAFGRFLTDRGYRSEQRGGGRRVRIGLRLA